MNSRVVPTRSTATQMMTVLPMATRSPWGANPSDSLDRPVAQAQSVPVAYLNTFVADTDGDGFSDRDEVASGTSPTDPQARPASQAQSVPWRTSIPSWPTPMAMASPTATK